MPSVLCDMEDLVKMLQLAVNGELGELSKLESEYTSRLIEQYEDISKFFNESSEYWKTTLDLLAKNAFKAGMAYALRYAISKYHLVDKFRLRLMLNERGGESDQA